MAESFLKLSGSTDGKAIKVTGTTSGAAVTVHQPAASVLDFVTIQAYNSDTVTRVLTLCWGGTGADNQFSTPIPPQSGLVTVTDRAAIGNSQVVSAFADAANVLFVYGPPALRTA
jgi:hypothetical protein